LISTKVGFFDFRPTPLFPLTDLGVESATEKMKRIATLYDEFKMRALQPGARSAQVGTFSDEPEEELSEYEQRRAANIERNESIMANLGLL